LLLFLGDGGEVGQPLRGYQRAGCPQHTSPLPISVSGLQLLQQTIVVMLLLMRLLQLLLRFG